MEHGERRRLQSSQRAPVVEVADKRDDAMRAQLGHVGAIARQADEMRALSQSSRDAQRDVAAAHQQHPLHHAAGTTIAPAIHPRARASCDPAQETSIPILTQPR